MDMSITGCQRENIFINRLDIFAGPRWGAPYGYEVRLVGRAW